VNDLEEEPFFDQGAASSFQSFGRGLAAPTSSDLMMLSKEAPIMGGKSRKRKGRGPLQQGTRAEKKRYEPASQFMAVPVAAKPVDIIHDLDLSPPRRGFGVASAPAVPFDPLDLTEVSAQSEVQVILFFNDGVQVNEDGTPLYRSPSKPCESESERKASSSSSSSGGSSSRSSRISPFGQSLQDAFASHHTQF
tara:strand:- start:251 stop:829 length:579 start_codon:yes stop_codon:yes gene_type:complete